VNKQVVISQQLGIDMAICVWHTAEVFHVGDVIRKLRTERGWTLDDLAARTNTNKNTLSAIERGVIVRGDSMQPMFRSGMKLIVSPNVPVNDGDAAYIQLRNGERLVKLVTRSEDGFVLESVNPQYRPRFVRSDGCRAYSQNCLRALPTLTDRQTDE
jgi:DNA-binding XRE family transcriptional regulator